nr:hypothetical protein [Tanacetum cinerariifolium]
MFFKCFEKWNDFGEIAFLGLFKTPFPFSEPRGCNSLFTGVFGGYTINAFIGLEVVVCSFRASAFILMRTKIFTQGLIVSEDRLNLLFTVSRFSDMHEALNATQKRIAELESENSNLQNKIQNDDHDVMAQLTEHHKSNCVTMPVVKSKVLAPGRYAIDIELIPPRIRYNREVHLDYLKHLKESVETLREIGLLEYVIGTCPKDFNQRDKKHAATPVTRKKQITFVDPCETSTNNTLTHVKQQTMHQTNEPVIPSIGVNGATAASESKTRSNTKKDMTLPAKSDMQKVEVHPRNNKSSVKQKNRVDSSISYKRTSRLGSELGNELTSLASSELGSELTSLAGSELGLASYKLIEDYFLATCEPELCPFNFLLASCQVSSSELQGKENGVNILKSIDEGPFWMGTLKETLTEGTEEPGPEMGEHSGAASDKRSRTLSDIFPLSSHGKRPFTKATLENTIPPHFITS